MWNHRCNFYCMFFTCTFPSQRNLFSPLGLVQCIVGSELRIYIFYKQLSSIFWHKWHKGCILYLTSYTHWKVASIGSRRTVVFGFYGSDDRNQPGVSGGCSLGVFFIKMSRNSIFSCAIRSISVFYLSLSIQQTKLGHNNGQQRRKWRNGEDDSLKEKWFVSAAGITPTALQTLIGEETLSSAWRNSSSLLPWFIISFIFVVVIFKHDLKDNE